MTYDYSNASGQTRCHLDALGLSSLAVEKFLSLPGHVVWNNYPSLFSRIDIADFELSPVTPIHYDPDNIVLCRILDQTTYSAETRYLNEKANLPTRRPFHTLIPSLWTLQVSQYEPTFPPDAHFTP